MKHQFFFINLNRKIQREKSINNLSHVLAVQNIRYIIRFMFLQGQRIENSIFKQGITLHLLEFLYKITLIDCEYVILFLLTQIDIN